MRARGRPSRRVTAHAAAAALALLACRSPAAPVGRIPPAPVIADATAGVELIAVEGGCFWMGASDDDCSATPEERPRHEVCVGPFLLGRFEVTRAQWRAVMGDDALAPSPCDADACPVSSVSWGDVERYLSRLNGKGAGHRYRLPTEAEWEFAARSGGKDERYSGGRDVLGAAWYSGNAGGRNQPVGTRAPNGLGFHDMSGNVWEMVSDWYASGYYSASPRDNPRGPSAGDDHVVRGGSRADPMASQRTTRRAWIRDRAGGADRADHLGFRLARDR